MLEHQKKGAADRPRPENSWMLLRLRNVVNRKVGLSHNALPSVRVAINRHHEATKSLRITTLNHSNNNVGDVRAVIIARSRETFYERSRIHSGDSRNSAAILAAPSFCQLESTRPFPALHSIIADAVIFAERILQRIDAEWPTKMR